jgi:hypothetical protein
VYLSSTKLTPRKIIKRERNGKKEIENGAKEKFKRMPEKIERKTASPQINPFEDIFLDFTFPQLP